MISQNNRGLSFVEEAFRDPSSVIGKGLRAIAIGLSSATFSAGIVGISGCSKNTGTHLVEDRYLDYLPSDARLRLSPYKYNDMVAYLCWDPTENRFTIKEAELSDRSGEKIETTIRLTRVVPDGADIGYGAVVERGPFVYRLQDEVAILKPLQNRILDETLCDQFHQTLVELAHLHPIILDLTSVEHISSATLKALSDAHKVRQEHGDILSICVVHPSISEVFKITRLNKVYGIFTNVADAMDARAQGVAT